MISKDKNIIEKAIVNVVYNNKKEIYSDINKRKDIINVVLVISIGNFVVNEDYKVVIYYVNENLMITDFQQEAI